MPRHSYREYDYSFGQTMLRLRTSLRLTQAGLADLLGVSRRAIGEWEGGLNYPKPEQLQHVLGLSVPTGCATSCTCSSHDAIGSFNAPAFFCEASRNPSF